MSKTDDKAAQELTEVMEKTMQRLQGRFQSMSEQLESKIDEMGSRIDDLEKNVSELMTQAGMEDQAAPKWHATLWEPRCWFLLDFMWTGPNVCDQDCPSHQFWCYISQICIILSWNIVNHIEWWPDRCFRTFALTVTATMITVHIIYTVFDDIFSVRKMTKKHFLSFSTSHLLLVIML